MMNRLFFCCLSALLCLLAACSPSTDDDGSQGGAVTVSFTAGGITEGGNAEGNNAPTRATTALPVGSTVRVIAYLQPAGTTGFPSANRKAECTYKVTAAGLAPCAVNADGTVNTAGTTPDDMLLTPTGTYTFYAITPAVVMTHGTANPTVSVAHGTDIAVSATSYAVKSGANKVILAALGRRCAQVNFVTDRVGTAINKVQIQSVTLTAQGSSPKTLTGTTALDVTGTTATVTVPSSAFVTDASNTWKQTGHTIVLPKANAAFKLKVSVKLNDIAAAKDYEVDIPAMAFAAGQAYNFTLKFNGIDMEVTRSEQWDEVAQEDQFGIFNLSRNGNANCYIVANNIVRDYYFDALVRGNGYESTTDPNVSGINYNTLPKLTDATEARVIWQTGTDASTLVIDPNSVRLASGKVYFTTTGKVNEGNAVIGLFASSDDSAPCLWSWHIWKLDGSVPADVDCQKYLNGNTANVVSFKMMALNLGAYNNTPGNTGSIGLFYQWGRKDPFPGSARFSPSEPTNIYGKFNNGGTTGSWDGDYSLKKSTTTAVVGTEAWATQYPTVFILGVFNDGSYEWYWGLKNDIFWGTPWKAGGHNDYNGNQGTKSIYDPCPVGYRVPPQDIWSKLTKGTWTSNGVTLGSLASLWHPAAGNRSGSTGGFGATGAEGFFWSSSAYNSENTSGGSMNFQGGATVYPKYNNSRSSGFPIRCVAE